MIPREGEEELDECPFLVWGQVQWPDLAIQIGIQTASPAVKLDHLIEHRQIAVVHIRRCLGHVSQGRHLKFSPVLLSMRDFKAPVIVWLFSPAHARVVKIFI